MKKGIFTTLAVLTIIIIAAVLYLWSSLNAIVEAAIEKYGSQVMHTAVSVSGVDIKLTEGSGAISGLTIANPKGFSEPDAFSLGRISLGIDLDSITKDTVIIKKIVVDSPKIFYEINKSGLGNINQLNKNISKSASSERGESNQAAGEDEKKLIIRKLVISQGELSARVAALDDKPLIAKLPPIEMKNIGANKGGASAAEISNEVLTRLVRYATDEIKKMGLEKYLGKSLEDIERETKQKLKQEAQTRLDKEVDKAISDKDKKRLEQGNEKLKNIFGK